MQLPDETISFNYQGLLNQPRPEDEWKPLVEMQNQQFLTPARLKAIMPVMMQMKGQVASERELIEVSSQTKPLDSGFIDLPDKLLGELRKNKEKSELGRIQAVASRLREQCDRILILGIGGSYMGAKALFEALRNLYHNELPFETRLGIPRFYFEGNNVDNDGLQELLELFQTTCLSPDSQQDRWATVVISKSGKTIETAAALRVFRKEAAELYGPKSELAKTLMIPVTGPGDSPLRKLMKSQGYSDDEIFTIPDRVGGRFSIFSAVGLLPAGLMGLDIRALLQGASSITRNFLEEPFERNLVLQFAAVCHLMTEERSKSVRVMAVWSKKLEALGMWYDQLMAESLGKQGRGATPLTSVMTRDLHSRGQQFQEGKRDKLIINVTVKTPKAGPISIGMSDRNEDGLNEFSRRSYLNLMQAANQGTNAAYAEVARPTCEITLPTLSEYNIGQLMQMLMLATVVEGKLMGINPYGQPGVEAYKRNMMSILRVAASQDINKKNTAE
ncbi:MAG: glucose-6-phosphate isomerase [Gemmatales bacterium]